MKNLYFLIFTALLFSCKTSETKQAEIKMDDPIDFESPLNEYLPLNCNVDYEHIFKNMDGEQIRLSGGEGYGYDKNTETKTSITKSLHGKIDANSFLMNFNITAKQNDPKNYILTYGLQSYGNCQTKLKGLNKSNTAKNDTSQKGNKLSLMVINSTDEKLDLVCNSELYTNPSCDISMNYEMCLEAGKGLTSFTFEGNKWTFVKSVKIEY